MSTEFVHEDVLNSNRATERERNDSAAHVGGALVLLCLSVLPISSSSYRIVETLVVHTMFTIEHLNLFAQLRSFLS